MNTPILEAHALTIGYRQGNQTRTVAESLNIALRAGELVCLLGQNGAGKSTLMRTLAGTQPPLSGQILLAQHSLLSLKPRQRARYLSIVTTERIDSPLMTGRLLVSLGRHPYTDWTGQLTDKDHERVAWAIHAVGGDPLAHRRVSELSDGERQKMLIARALAQEPQVILLDEPTAFLDLPRRVEILYLLRRLAHENQRAILLSTHDLDLALRMADVIWLMSPNAPFTIGAPEDLVLSGVFEQAFSAEGVRFDSTSGTFTLSQHPKAMITVIGEGVRAIWTKRALERANYGVGESEWYVQVSPNGWRVGNIQHATSSFYSTLADVLRMIEAEHRAS